MQVTEKIAGIAEAPEGMRPLSREKREAILAGAAAVFAEHGYEGASMSMITRAAGVSKGTIYQHFPGKAALFGAAVARKCRQSLAPLFEGVEAGAGLEETLRQIALRFIQLLMSDEGVAVERTVHAEALRFPELADAFWAAGPGPAIAMMTRLIEARVARGELAVPDPGLAAEQFFTLCQTRVVHRRRLGQNVPADEIPYVAAQTARMFLAAYAVR